ncbi:Cell division protein FtsQ [Candidatus Gullanella endobia]|uniref:Cell division protein FtsQ n=1 Tax=Candidatus Gullanella endobia TaxID=1070130 RepID=A0A143WTZ6_9ENTR|nr:cell division protein FtsQ [Candidatus Gullanella endobia]CUX96329.1 Cell division protein FtsQ [Candidatus Gullanella endobia]
MDRRIIAEHINFSQLTGLIFLLILLYTLLLGGWIIVDWMKDTYHLPLSRLIVTGYRHYTTNDDIRNAILALGTTDAFIRQEVNIIHQQIKRMPWIKKISVCKRWPDELKIHFLEYVPIARWNDQYLLDSSSQVFSAPSERISNHPILMLYGPEGSEREILNEYRIMNEMLMTTKFQIKSVSMSARHSWQLTLRDGIKLELGRDDRAKRLKRFIRIYPILLQQAINDNKRISYIDMRYKSGLAVGWAEIYTGSKINNQQ